MEAVFLRGRRNTLEYRVWSRWLNAAAALSSRYCQEMPDEDPFAYNETASVSILAAAAACAGFIGLAEFSTAKANQRNRGRGWGRSDFWMLASRRSWAFEFKQLSPSRPPDKRLGSYMEKAEECAGCILQGDADAAVAGLIVPLHYIHGQSLTGTNALERARSNLMKFAQGCEFAWSLSG